MFHCPEFTNFRDPENPHDRVIVVEEVKFYVYYGLLASWSDFFRAMNNASFKESEQDEIEVGEVSAEDFEDFLHLISPDDFEITESNYCTIIRLSFRFLAPRVLKLCEKFINFNYESMDKIQLLDVASEHALPLSENVADSIMNSIPSLDPLILLKVAFKHDLESVKANISQLVADELRTGTLDHCINQECNIMMYTGHPCPCGAEFQKSEQFLMFPRKSFLFRERDRILELPSDIQKFLLHSIIFAEDDMNLAAIAEALSEPLPEEVPEDV